MLWAAGVRASPLGKALEEATGAELDRQGRVCVEPDLSLPNHPEILVLGPVPGKDPAPGDADGYRIRSLDH